MGINLTVEDKIRNSIKKKQELGLYRKRSALNLKKYKYNFSSNDYLSLSRDRLVNKFYQDGFDKYPVGSTGSFVISGYDSIHQDLEKYIASLLGVDACVLFSSGYVANLSVVSLLAEYGVHLLIDKSVHASIYDGISLSRAEYTRFLHNDITSFTKKLHELRSIDLAILTESIFSMSGTLAHLKEFSDLSRDYNVPLIVDEAHAFGVIGKSGLGGVYNAGLTQQDVPIRVIPFGKSVGACGAVVAGSRVFMDALVQMRPLVYSTAISPAFAYGLLKTIEYMQDLDDRRQKLVTLVSHFRRLIESSHLKWRDSKTQIQQLQLGCPFLAIEFAEKLAKLSINCMPVRQPTVNKEETGLRVILNYHHEIEDIDYLFNCLHTL